MPFGMNPAFDQLHDLMSSILVFPGRQDADIAHRAHRDSLSSFVGSPRLSHLHEAATRTIANGQ